ncbi:HAMP domain-containing histidine kinase [bacterium]|nr:HAMP domain-containing histidine kinase [bacterium]
MINRRSSLFHILVFIFAQVAWLSLLGLWIYRFVATNLVMDQVSDRLMVSGRFNLITLISGIVLFVTVSVGMALMFRRLNVQMNLTSMYDNFIANITHELKSPLASIQLYLETMQLRELQRSRQQEFLALMIKDANRLQYLINSILEVSGLEQKRIVYKCEVYDAGAVIKSIIKESSEQFKLNNSKIQIVGGAARQCVVDRDALKIVFDNLIDNAIKYSTGDVRININLKHTEKWIVVEFADQGIGIDIKDQKVVFQKFERIYHADVPNVKGTGLGLFWVREIIRYHGGKVRVRSRGHGKGTTFTIELPIYQVSQKRTIDKLLKLASRIRREQEARS